ncbi:MAG: hypothetical protein EAZ07_05560 [Cytophagales bacterium]|nr:MAG: hypothetical protein EAZ07_05560 [Cytophagales bacterium]
MPMVKTRPNDNTALPSLAFNNSAEYKPNSHVIEAIVNDSLIITLKNNDNISHRFSIQNTEVSNIEINSQSTIIIRTKLKEWGCYIYYDPLDMPKNSYLGLGGILAVAQNNKAIKPYFWNIKTHSINFNRELALNNSVDWLTFYPDYYTLNALSYPSSILDETSSITAKFNDTIHIYMANTGIAEHVIHFHGYHCKVLQTNKNKKQIGYSKDSFPLEPMQGTVLELVLYNKGKYPVHDHNLLAMTGNKIHPYGMLVLIDVK